MNRAPRCALALAVLWIAAPAPSRAAGDLDTLVRKVIDAYGGEKALRKATTRIDTGTVNSTMSRGAGAVTRTFQRPDKLRVEIRFPGEGGELRILDGGTGWRQGEQVSGAQLDSMALQAARLALPLSLLERRAGLRDAGSVNRDGKELRVIEYPPAAGMRIAAEIDPASGRILRTTGSSRSSAESPVTIEFVTEYADFRKVGGVLVPFREQNFAMGTRTGETILKRVEIGKALPGGTFAP